MWTRNNDVSNQNMLKHFIYLSFSKLTTSLLCSIYYRYSLKLSSFFCILSFLVRAISIDQTFYSVTHYLAAMWLNSKYDFDKNFDHAAYVKNIEVFNIILKKINVFLNFELILSFNLNSDESKLHHATLTVHSKNSSTLAQFSSHSQDNTYDKNHHLNLY